MCKIDDFEQHVSLGKQGSVSGFFYSNVPQCELIEGNEMHRQG
jgi:hypothetical protein